MATYEVADLPILHPRHLPDEANRLFLELADREIQNVFDETKQPDRRALDDVIFIVLGLTQGEREAVYEAVVELVRKRLEKARSV